MRLLCRKHGFAALLLVVMAPCVASAQDLGVTITDLTVGFDGICRVGSWTPIRVTLQSKSETYTGHVELVVPDGDGVPSRVSTEGLRPVLIPAGGSTTITLYARLGRINAKLGASFWVDEKVIARADFRTNVEDAKRTVISADRELIVAVGSSIGLQSAIDLRKQQEHEESVVAQLSSSDELPTRWYGYEGVNIVVLATGNMAAYRNFTGGTAQAKALDEWVRRGGRLVLCVGKNAPLVLDPRHRDESNPTDAEDLLHPLSRFAPGRFAGDEMATLRSAGELEKYSDQKKPVEAVGNELRLSIPRLSDVDGFVEVSEGANLPLVVRSAYGFGEVVFVSVDLDLAPLSRWAGRGQMVNKLLGYETAVTQDSQAQTMHRPSYSDHAGQLRAALDRFEGIRLVPFSLVAFLILLYVILIGPVDYFVLKKYFKRMEYTWITFPLIVLVFSVGAYGLAYWLKGSQIRINQIDLVDVDVESGTVRGVTWVNLFSPRTDGYDLSVQPQPVVGGAVKQPDVLFSWLGLPGGALGGMEPSTQGLSFFDAYAFSPQLDRVEQMPVAVWSTKSLTARWQYELGTARPFDASLRRETLGLRGEITSRLDFSLIDCVVLHGGVAYVVGDVEPGATIVLDSSLQAPGAAAYWKSKISGAVAHHDDERLEPEHTVRAMMFHRLVKGKQFTRLRNRYQSFVDLSSHVERAETGRAILVGRGAEGRPGAKLVDGDAALGNEDDEHTTIYRFVFRVEDD